MIGKEIKSLFAECFPDTLNEMDIILGFAKQHGEIHEAFIGNELANIVCTAKVFADLPEAEYVFACGTSKKHRGIGIFKKRLNEIIGEKCAILIPENESLFGMYEKLGFESIYCCQAFFGGRGAKDCESSTQELYKAYESSCLYPKKSISAFEATLRAFRSYGNTVKTANGVPVLVQGNTACEIFAQNEEAMLSAASCFETALLPLAFADLLERRGIKYEKTKLASAKNLPEGTAERMFINNLFN